MAQPMTQRASPMKRAQKTFVRMQGPMPMMDPGVAHRFARGTHASDASASQMLIRCMCVCISLRVLAKKNPDCAHLACAQCACAPRNYTKLFVTVHPTPPSWSFPKSFHREELGDRNRECNGARKKDPPSVGGPPQPLCCESFWC